MPTLWMINATFNSDFFWDGGRSRIIKFCGLFLSGKLTSTKSLIEVKSSETPRYAKRQPLKSIPQETKGISEQFDPIHDDVVEVRIMELK